jgi:putative spermidine/putrescine transport system permease protein
MTTTAKRILQDPSLMQTTTMDPSVRHQQREDRAMLLLLAPALFVVVVLLVVPLAWLSWQSIWHDGGFTLVNDGAGLIASGENATSASRKFSPGSWHIGRS